MRIAICFYNYVLRFFVLLAVFMVCCQVHAGAIKDSESSSHADQAAFQDIVKKYEFEGVKIIQFNLAVLSHYSYMILSGKDAMVVDPGRDIGAYIDIAEKEGVSITGIFLTHSHADFVAGHIELAKSVSCPIYQSKESGAKYKFNGLSDSEQLTLGDSMVKFLKTPGHTPDGMCALIFSRENKSTPRVILTGDTLFVGSIGRPDLMGGAMAAATLAGMSYDTWTNKLSKLDDQVIVLPAHGAGSLCGAHLRDEPSSTIGMEKTTNPYIQHKGRNDFIMAVLEGLPDAPQYFRHNATMNREGPKLVDWNRKIKKASVQNNEFNDISKVYIVDLRDARLFAEGHIPNSVNIGLRGRLETWLGIMVPWGSNVVLVGNDEEIREGSLRLNRIGYEVNSGLSFDDWKASGKKINTNETISPRELYRRIQEGRAPVIVDVRLPAEWMGLRIGNVVNMPLNQLGVLCEKLEAAEPVVTVCNSAYRSSMGIGVLERKGFMNVASMDGGGEAWIKEGLPVIQPAAQGSSFSGTKRIVKLPDRIEPAQLKRLIMDLPGTFDLVDIRPVDHFNDYNLPGSHNVDVSDLISSPVFLTGGGPLVIVDRDGSIAMAAGGILSQKTERQIKVLFGGLEAYWQNSEMGEPVRTVPLNSAVRQMSPTVPKTTDRQASPKPETPKKKSAGC